MQEILKKLTELICVCETRVKKLEGEKSALESLRVQLNSQKTDQDLREKDIQAQKNALENKKLIVKTIDEAQAILKENTAEKKRLKTQADELALTQEKHRKKIADDLADLNRQKEKIAAMNKETETKATNYRVEVMEQILKESASKAGK
jgi:hypothetical protein